MKASGATELSPGLFECLALLAAVALQIASLLTSLQEQRCASLEPGVRAPFAATLDAAAAAESCRGG